MSLTVYRCVAAGGADGTLATAAATWTALDAILIAAGWAAYDTIAADDVVYASAGETTFDTLYFRITLATSAIIQFRLYQYWDVTGHQGYNQQGGIDGTNTFPAYGRFDWTGYSADTYDAVFVADRDNFAFYSRRRGDGTVYFQTGGNLMRLQGSRKRNLATTATLTTGESVSVTCSADPASYGYKVNDVVMVLAQQTTGTANNTIPCFATYIQAIDSGTNTITLAKVPEACDAGALIGDDPMPFFLVYTGGTSYDVMVSGGDPFNYGNTCRMDVTNIRNASGNSPYVGYGGRGMAAMDPASTQPSRRTNRIGMSRILIRSFSTDFETRGYVDKLYFFHKSVTRFDIARLTKSTPTQDHVIVQLPAAGSYYTIGPVA